MQSAITKAIEEGAGELMPFQVVVNGIALRDAYVKGAIRYLLEVLGGQAVCFLPLCLVACYFIAMLTFVYSFV